jgi:hypothetical protein
MSEGVSRVGAVISAYDAAAVVSRLTEQPECPLGRWRMTTNRWELWASADRPQLLAGIDVVYDAPYPHAVTLTRVETSDVAVAAGLDAAMVVDLALQVTGVRLADCPRSLSAVPEAFSNRRRTDRAAWAAESQPADPEGIPLLRATETTDEDPALDAAEDRELRRLHYLATFGGLTGGLAERYAELRNRDRREGVREPQDDDLVVLPRQRSTEAFDADDVAAHADAG